MMGYKVFKIENNDEIVHLVKNKDHLVLVLHK